MMIDIGIVGCIGLVLTDWIMHHYNAIKYYIKDMIAFYYNADKEIFGKHEETNFN